MYTLFVSEDRSAGLAGGGRGTAPTLDIQPVDVSPHPRHSGRVSQPLIVFAHGAGAPSSSGWMLRWKQRLGALGPVVTFDYPYMARGSRRPDPMPELVRAHRSAIEAARTEHGAGRRLVLAGKSMGSRIGCHVALAPELGVSALVCFGYPLKGAGKAGKLRDAVLLELGTPILFLQGSRDPLCPLDRLEDVRGRMKARSELHVVEAGDHSLEVGKRVLLALGATQEEIDDAVFSAVRSFLACLDRA
jgi:uncharacterized protein